MLTSSSPGAGAPSIIDTSQDFLRAGENRKTFVGVCFEIPLSLASANSVPQTQPCHLTEQSGSVSKSSYLCSIVYPVWLRNPIFPTSKAAVRSGLNSPSSSLEGYVPSAACADSPLTPRTFPSGI